MTVTKRRALAILIGFALLIAAWLTPGVAAQRAPSIPALHAKVSGRLFIRNAMVIYGSGRPPYGPADIVVENGRIASIGSPGESVPRPADAVIDATGKYVMPGIVNTHMHWHEERQPGMPQPIQYERNLYLAAGITTVFPGWTSSQEAR